jgi:hypothetical protein
MKALVQVDQSIMFGADSRAAGGVAWSFDCELGVET